jgi:predicted HTH domain antitoxin
MKGAIGDPEIRRILNTGQNETRKETALRMLKAGELSVDKIAEYAGLKVEEVKQLAELQNT